MKLLCRSILQLEALESRITPASVVQLIDLNGDKVTFRSSLGDLTGHIIPALANDGVHNVYDVDLSDASFLGTNFSATVSKAGGGDGQLIVGHIGAGTNDLGKVSVAGDLGDIDCGSGSAKVAAIKSLTVNSLGRFGQPGLGNFVSNVNGSAGSLVVKGDQIQTYFRVVGDLASASIGGSLIGADSGDSGEIYATGSLGKVTIKHDIRGGDGVYSGSVGAGLNVNSVTVGGSVFGGKGDNSGDIYAAFAADGRIGNVSIGGSLVGGDGRLSGAIGGVPASVGTGNNVSLGIVTIGHDIVGGHGEEDAEVRPLGGTLDQLTVKGSVIGGSGDYSADIKADGAAGKIFIGGSICGGSGSVSALIELNGGAKSLRIGGSLLGGKGIDSADIGVAGAPLELLKIGHDIRGGSGNLSAEVTGTITTRLVGGSVIPGTGTDSGKFG